MTQYRMALNDPLWKCLQLANPLMIHLAGETVGRYHFSYSKQNTTGSASFCLRRSLAAVHLDAVVGPVVIVRITFKDIRYIANDALCARIVLAWKAHSR